MRRICRPAWRRSLTTAAAHYLADCRLAAPKQIRVESSGARWPSSIEDAYAQQAVLHEIMWERGNTVVGNKIGCTTSVMQKYLGIAHPCSGGIYDSRLWRQSAAEEPVTVPAGHALRLGLECELAVILGSTIEPDVSDLASLARAISSVHAAIECVDDRYEDFASRRPGAFAWIADDFFSCGSILGPALPVDPQRLRDLSGAMWVNDVCVGEGAGSDIIAGDPLEALRWLAASEATAAMGGLPKGWVVSLGSVCKTHWLRDAQEAGAAQETVVRVAFTNAEDARSADEQGRAEQCPGGSMLPGERILASAPPEGILTARLDFH